MEVFWTDVAILPDGIALLPRNVIPPVPDAPFETFRFTARLAGLPAPYFPGRVVNSIFLYIKKIKFYSTKISKTKSQS